MVFARTADGDIVTYQPTENQHVNGILDISIAPARISNRLAEKVCAATLTIAQRLDYCGVACVEYFVLGDDSLVANEIAPRPHNSGHYTIDANVTSQFEQQVRALVGLPLGSAKQHCAAVMVNLLGDLWDSSEPNWQNLLAHACTKLHLYGKSEPRSGRKMGHYTCLDESLDKALDVALQIREQLISKIPMPSNR